MSSSGTLLGGFLFQSQRMAAAFLFRVRLSFPVKKSSPLSVSSDLEDCGGTFLLCRRPNPSPHVTPLRHCSRRAGCWHVFILGSAGVFWVQRALPNPLRRLWWRIWDVPALGPCAILALCPFPLASLLVFWLLSFRLIPSCCSSMASSSEHRAQRGCLIDRSMLGNVVCLVMEN